MPKQRTDLIKDGGTLTGAKYTRSGITIPVYDDGFGKLYVHRHSMGISGIVRAQTWEDAYSICEDEFFPEADETIEEIVKEYGFKREHKKVVADSSVTVATDVLNAGERFAVYPDDYPDGKLAPTFIRWQTIETPAPDEWMDNELFQEGFGFRPNGPNKHDKLNHGIYWKDLNGDSLDVLTQKMLDEWGIELEIETEESES